MLADRTATLLEMLAEYGRIGSYTILEKISNYLQEFKLGRRSCRIPLETSVSVLTQCIRVLKNRNNSKRRWRVWLILLFISNRALNALAPGLLTQLDSTDLLGLIPASIASLSAENDLEAVLCLRFISCFARSYEHRQLEVGRTEGLLEAVLHAINTLFIPVRDAVKCELLRALLVLVSASDPIVADKFIRNGGFCTVNVVFGCIYQTCVQRKVVGTSSFDGVGWKLLHNCFSVMFAMFGACSLIDASTTNLPRTMYSYDPASLILTTSALHEIITMANDTSFMQHTVLVIEKFFVFVEKVHPESLEFALLYRGKKLSPTAYAGVPMIIHAVLLTRDPQFKHLTQAAQECMVRYCSRFPTVDKLYHEILSTQPVEEPASGPAPHVCALPGCYVSSISYGNLMKQCGRCRAVFYCALDHQNEHWKEHKLVCVRKKKQVRDAVV